MANWWDAAPAASPFDVAVATEGYDPKFATFANSIYMQESSGGKNAKTSNAGAVGGMQIIPSTFKEVADEGWDINNPEHNLRAGLRYLKKMYDAGGGDPYLAAVGYYGGPGAIKAMQNGQVRRDPRNPNAPDTAQYADQVLSRAGINWWDSAPLAEEPQTQAPAAPQQATVSPQQAPNYSGGIPWNPNQIQPDGLSDPVLSESAPSPRNNGFWSGVGESLMDTGRQLGLTGRYAIEGIGQAAGIVTEPARQLMNLGLGAAGLPTAASTADAASALANAIGLPSPQTSDERVVGDISRTMAGAGGIAGLSNLAARGVTGLTQYVLSALGSSPAQQVVGAAGAGALGGSVREAGGGDIPQALAAVAGGLAAPMAVGRAQSVVSGLGRRAQAMSPTQVESTVKVVMAQSGVDYSKLPQNVQKRLTDEAKKALVKGDLDPAAMARLADFARIEGATPTRGMLTQDPQQITREMNLAKQQANSTALGGSNLAQVQSQNNAALVKALDSLGITDDTAAAGGKAVDALQRRLSRQKATVSELYDLAKDSVGRSVPLNGRAFADQAIKALDDNLSGGFLPVEIRNHLNNISQGQVPFTVDYAEQLKTVIGRLQRNSSDGNARYALGLVRQALDDTPVMQFGAQPSAPGARAVNPGNLSALRNDAEEFGREAIEAFNQARSANRQMMGQIEGSPALKAIYEDNVNPETFVSKFITSPSVKPNDVQVLSAMLKADPAAYQAVRSGILQQLKDRALSGVPDDIGSAKFSPSQYARALKTLSTDKLSAFFTPQEIDQLKAISRVGRVMVNQPVGSAVNNSNTAAAVASHALDAIGGLGRGLKLFGIGDQVAAIQSGLAQRSAQQVPAALVQPGARLPSQNRLIPASMGSALLLSSPSAQNN